MNRRRYKILKLNETKALGYAVEIMKPIERKVQEATIPISLKD